jgi:hypothetical protein
MHLNISMTPPAWQRLAPSLALIMGLFAFWVWAGAYTLAPGHLGWIMAGIDTPTHYEGWQFFRHSPRAQWPLGLNRAYGTDASATILLSDSIPLMAIPLKFFSPLLPAAFQYLGLWALACFLLQAWFAFKLVGRLTNDTVVCLAGTAFFLSASIFLLRIYMHPALSAQWLIIAGFYLAFDEKFRSRAWFILLCVAIWVHAYLFVMVAFLWLADIVQRLWRRECSPKKSVLHGISVFAVVLILMWAAGYFVSGPALGASIRAHLDLFFPLWTGIRFFGEWSWFVPGSNMDFLAYDGFGYFGLGFIFLSLSALGLSATRVLKNHHQVHVQSRPTSTWLILTLVCIVLLIYALGNKIYFSQHLLFSYPLPFWLDRIYSLFRASARMMWPAWYLALFAVFYVLLKKLPLRYVQLLVVFALIVQLADLSKAAVDIRAWASKNRTWHSAMVSPVWSELGVRYKHLAYLQPSGFSAGMITFVPSYRSVADYAAIHDMTINIAYLAREDDAKIARARTDRINMLKHGTSEPDTMYVIEDVQLWGQLICTHGSTLWYGTVDGLRLILPQAPRSVSVTPAQCGA